MMEETVLTDDSMDDQYDRPKTRWGPVGAVASPPPSVGSAEDGHVNMVDQLQHLEEEQEQLNSSLLALTTHFAQVQFRLKQIVNAPIDDKENLLKDLEEFAFKGCPDVRGSRSQDAQMLEDASEKEHESRITEQREKQMELISQLKSQLDDLEQFAYEEGSGELPQNMILEKQNVIIEELKQKLGLNIEDMDKLTTDDLRQLVDSAIGRIVNPAKVKETVIHQLKNQIGDLERFISFLQGEASTPGLVTPNSCSCPVDAKDDTISEADSEAPDCCVHPKAGKLGSKQSTAERIKKMRESHISSMKKALALLQYMAITQLGCGTDKLKEKKTAKPDASDDYREMLKVLDAAVNHVIMLARQQQESPAEDSDYTSDSSDSPVNRPLDDVTVAVRRELAPALRDLFEHGQFKHSSSSDALITPITACLATHRNTSSQKVHAWDLFVKYYDIKKGKAFAMSPARKLSQAFDIDIVGGTAITAKQTLLAAIDYVSGSHEPLKRSKEAQFKAFVSEALNGQKLAIWCRLISRTTSLIDYHYYPWSYMMKNSFDGALQLLDKLSEIKFRLNVDIAVQQFYNIKDAF
ncbi:RUN domain-containing protein 1-like isoform X2 [Patiria miniata]|uniref:RUN domain-containing protein n=1 Tax=Patiria miniata TaxID=46514 RepID=A0A913ZPX7_PATMI|nr:RUN domain-containing protein 1-like isoform X2 [Patiria miniata]XP_038053424.1 RUN domain-containing protein 1-like isoform X2 [Patiria miniata]XP_038053425.1 RUN domain-containing protein 1-like isoform X2 [Patiria miniata]XP_038053426.1 RUN domain-containing protein 1-like isoform X2 [Patiria miniata]